LVKQNVSDKPRVLVVEDEPIAREILGDLLKMAGYEVLSVHSGEQALLTLMQERGRIHCLYTAIELPGLVDGWMLADEFRVTDAALPIVFSATSKPAKGRCPAGTAFVARPVLPPKAVEAVNKVTGKTAADHKSRHVPPRVVAETEVPQPVELPEQVALASPLKAVG
jgi:two-component system OmpR family response regulator